MNIRAMRDNRLLGDKKPVRKTGTAGKIRLDRSWAFYGLFIFWAAGFSGEFQSRGLYGAIVFGLSTVFLALLSTLLHELGHRVAGRILRCPYDGSRLSFWGGFPEHRVDFGPPGPAAIVVRMAGPAINLLLWQTSLSLLGFAGGDWTFFFPQLAYLLRIFADLNLFIALLNVFPGFPFDMGVVVALVFSGATGSDRPGEGSLPEKIGWIGGFLLSLVGLLLVAGGMLVSGFGGIILGYLILSILMDFRERNRIARILEERGIKYWIQAVPAVARPDMWVQEIILGPIYRGTGSQIPVISQQGGHYLGEISWDLLRSRSFSQWDGVKVSDLPGIEPGPVIDEHDPASRMIEVLGIRPEGVPVLREGRLVGWLRRDPLVLSATVDVYLDRIPYATSSQTDRSAIPPEFSSSTGNASESSEGGRVSPGSSGP